MATKKPKPSVKQAVVNISGRPIVADALLGAVVSDVEKKMAKEGMLIGNDSLLHVLPVPAISIRYLLQNEGWPLSGVYQVVGAQASYKSTFAVEVARWHRMCGGFGVIQEAESKPTPDLRNSVLNWDEKALRVEDCQSVEDWQFKSTHFIRGVQKRMEQANGPGRTVPFINIVDSLMGKRARKTMKDIEEKGHASPHFATEARMISDYMGTMPNWLVGWPFTFLGVNHLKASKDPLTGMIDRTIPGGWALKFEETMEIEMSRMGAIKEFANFKVAALAMMTYKNSHGPDKIRIHVRFKTWDQEDAPDVHRLHSRFEWWESSVLLLAKGDGMRKTISDRLLPQIKEICDFHEKSGGSAGKLWWSTRLGVPSSDAMPAHDLGVLLEQRPEVLSELYPVLGIRRRPFFRPGVDYLTQLDAYAHVAQQADVADDMVRRGEELQRRASELGVTAGAAPIETTENDA